MRKPKHMAKDNTEVAPAREQLIELSLDMLCVFEDDGYFKVLNPAWTATLGWSETELRARPITEFVHPDDRAHAVHTLAQLAAGKFIRDHVYRFHCKDGSYRWVSANSSPGTAGLSVAVLRDITPQQAMATALRERAHELQLLIDNIPGLISRVDRNLRYLFANAEYERVFGTAAEDVIGHTMPEILGADLFADLESPVQRVLAGETVDFEFTITRAVGSDLHRWGRFVPEWDSSGKVKGFLIVGFDVTTQKRANALLALQATALRNIAVNAPLADTLQTLLRLTEAQGKDMLCSIQLLDVDGLHMRCGVAPSIPGTFIHAFDGQPIGPGAGSCGTAAYRRETVVVEDIASDPLWRDYRDAALAHGLYACWSTPIFGSEREVLGTFAIYYRDRRPPLPEEHQLIEMVIDLAAIAITRQREESQLRTIEQRLRHIGDNLPETVLYQLVRETDNRMRFVYVSSAVERVNGVTVDAVLADSQTLYSQILPEDALLIAAAEAESLRTMSAFKIEIRIRTSGGELRWIKLRSAPRALGDGRVIWDGFLNDITERKGIEQTLHDSQERLSRTIEATPSGIVIVDGSGFFVFANKEAEKLLGLSAKDLTARAYDDPPWLLRHLDGAPFASSEMPCKRAFDTNQSVYGIERVIQHPDGTQFLLSVNAAPLRDAGGTVTGVVAALTDITTIRRTALALQASEQQLRLYVEHSPAAIAVLDRDMRYLIVSRRWVDFYRLGDQSLVGRSHYELLPNMPTHWREINQRSLAGAINSHNAEAFVQSDGQTNWLRWETRPWRYTDGTIGGIIIFTEDITARKLAEDALRTHEARLQMLSQRLIEVQETERATIARELHDEIGQTLTALKLNMQWLQLRVTGTALDKVTASVELAGNALAQTRNLTLDLRPPQLDALGLAAALCDQAKRIAASAGFAVRFVIETEHGTDKSTRAITLFRIAQEALTNVARHAGAREVLVELRQRDGELIIAISDDGHGFNLETERDRALKRGSMGLLGMEERVSLVGGRLQIVTRPGHGTRIQASYPLEAAKIVREGVA